MEMVISVNTIIFCTFCSMNHMIISLYVYVFLLVFLRCFVFCSGPFLACLESGRCRSGWSEQLFLVWCGCVWLEMERVACENFGVVWLCEVTYAVGLFLDSLPAAIIYAMYIFCVSTNFFLGRFQMTF